MDMRNSSQPTYIYCTILASTFQPKTIFNSFSYSKTHTTHPQHQPYNYYVSEKLFF